ncbi:MAG: SMP-30/gluconolactonase/LRE family protein [Bryobacteraceae bacterium]
MKVLAAWVCLLPLAQAQYYVISTVAGNGQVQFSDGGGAATSARLITPRYAAADAAGNVFVSDNYYHQVFQISAGGTITVAAGTGRQGFSGDGGRATAAQLDGPAGLAVDNGGNLYIADSANSRIRKVSADGVITTVAGNGRAGVEGDGGMATAAAVGGPLGITVDAAGNLYISQSGNHVVRRVGADGAISRFAGTGAAGFSGDGGAATAAMLFNPQGVKADGAGNVYVADNQNHRIRRITPQGTISTVAGNGTIRFAGDGAAATLASLSGPADVAIDSNNNLYISDLLNGRVRMVNAAGVISTVAGGGGSLQNGPALQASLPAPTGLAIDSTGRLIVAVNFARQVRRVAQQTVTTIAGALPTAGAGDNAQATSATLLSPFGVAVDTAGNVYVSDQVDNRVRKISPAGIITTAGGTGLYGWNGDGGPATVAAIGSPRGLFMDPQGNLHLVSGAMSGVRRIAANGTVSTVAGIGSAGYSGDGMAATEAQLNIPLGVAVDAAGNTYIADTNNHRIRRVDATTRIITTIAGTGIAGFSGDNGPGAQAQLFQPRQIAIDGGGNLYITDTGNNRIRRIAPQGAITTVAGTGVNAFSGDGGPATMAQLAANGVAVDSAGNLYIAGSGRIRKVDGGTGIISTIAGTGTFGFSGDGGLGTSGAIDGAISAAVDGQGNVYITDERNSRVRKLTPAQIVPEGVANAGTLRAGAVAPGEVISIFGFGVGPAVAASLQLDASGRVATQLAGTQVTFDGAAAPLTYVSSSQVNAIVPYAVAGATSTKVQVIFQNRATNTITLPVAASAPGVFAITNEDGGVNSVSNPAAQGSILILYGTGEGQTAPGGIDGSVATSVFPKPILPVSVQAGGQTAEVLYAGAAPGFVAGVLQINMRIPAGVRGTAPLQLRIGEATTPAGLNVFVRGE